MLISLSEVMTIVGQTKHMEVPLELTHINVHGQSYKIIEKNPVDLEITCIAERKVRVICKTKMCIIIPCSRCLEDVKVSFSIDFDKEFDFREVDGSRNEELDEATYIQEYDLNVTDLVSEEVLIQFPLQVLCKEECRGICNDCGINKNYESCHCDEKGRDPRMLAIQDIFKNFGQADE